MRTGTVFALMSVLLLAGCGSSNVTVVKTVTVTASTVRQATALPAAIPHPRFAAVLPPNYRASKVWYHRLGSQGTPDAIITSTGPPIGSLSFHSSDLQVLSWDPIARRWTVSFDAQKVAMPDTSFGTAQSNAPIEPFNASAAGTNSGPILDRQGDVGIGQVAFVRFAPKQGTDLAFTASTSYGGSGTGTQLEVVDFANQEANIAYSWSGEGLYGFTVSGPPSRERLQANAAYWTVEDPHCCALRSYRFTVGAVRTTGNYSYITELSDQRPFLGLYLKSSDPQEISAPVTVLGVVPGSPAAALFRTGDLILSVANAPKLKSTNLLGPEIVDELAEFNAGEKAEIVVRRGGATLTITATLGSMIDSSAASAAPTTSDYSIATS